MVKGGGVVERTKEQDMEGGREGIEARRGGAMEACGWGGRMGPSKWG